MDHVLSKEESEEYADYILDIPWLGYDHEPSQAVGDFEDYAIQRDWSSEQLQHLKEGRLRNIDTTGLKPFLQSWFSFGLCEIALGTSLFKDAFLVVKDAKVCYTSEPLRQILQTLQTRFENTPREDPPKTQLLERLIKVLGSASVWARMLSDKILFLRANPDFSDQTYEGILRLFTLTGRALEHAAIALCRFVDGSFRSRLQNSWTQIPANTERLRNRLVARDWCPYVMTILSPFHQVAAEYAAIVGPPSTRFLHKSCSVHGCVRHNIDASTYKPTHVQPDCQCAFVRPKSG